MGLFDNIQGAVKNAGDRAGDAIEMTKLKSRVSSEKKEVQIEMSKIGKIFYDRIKNGEIEPDDDLNNIIERIDAQKATIDELQESLSALAGE